VDERPNKNSYPLHSVLRQIQELIAVTWPVQRRSLHLNKRTSSGVLVAALVVACWASAASAEGFGRLEIHAIPSVTVSNEQFLTGDRYGKPVIIGGELRVPRGATEKFSTVILIHGSGGISAATDRWAQELNSVGVAAFILDSFNGRGIINTNADQSQLESIAMMHDAFAAVGAVKQFLSLRFKLASN